MLDPELAKMVRWVQDAQVGTKRLAGNINRDYNFVEFVKNSSEGEVKVEFREERQGDTTVYKLVAKLLRKWYDWSIIMSREYSLASNQEEFNYLGNYFESLNLAETRRTEEKERKASKEKERYNEHTFKQFFK